MYNNHHDKAQAQGVSRAQRQYLRSLKTRDAWMHITRWGLLALLLLAWEAAAHWGWIDAFLLSSPSRMAKAAIQLAAEGSLWLHVRVTLVEALLGFTLGLGIGFALAVLLWWFPFWRKTLDPYLVILNALPKIALGPVLIVWIGIGMPAIVAMAVLVSVIVALATILGGLMEISEQRILLMRSLGATKLQVLCMLVIPGSTGPCITAVKLCMSMSWVGVIVGEFLVSRAGLGYLTVYGGQVFRLDLVMMSTAILCALAGGMYALIALWEKRRHRLRRFSGDH